MKSNELLYKFSTAAAWACDLKPLKPLHWLAEVKVWAFGSPRHCIAHTKLFKICLSWLESIESMSLKL